MRAGLAVLATAVLTTPAFAQWPRQSWDYRGDAFVPITDPIGPNDPPVRIYWVVGQPWNWTKAEPGVRVPYPGLHTYYAPLNIINAWTVGNILDPSYSASAVSPFSVTAEIRDRTGAVGSMSFEGELSVLWHGSWSGEVRDAWASGSIGQSPDYHRTLVLGDTKYDVTLGFGWGPWYAPGWDDRPSGDWTSDGQLVWTGQAGEFSLTVTETRNTPEPGTLVLAGLGCGVLVICRWRRGKPAVG